MQIRVSFDPNSFVRFDQERGELVIETADFLYSPPYISTWKWANDKSTELKGYHVKTKRGGKIKLVPYA